MPKYKLTTFTAKQKYKGKICFVSECVVVKNEETIA